MAGLHVVYVINDIVFAKNKKKKGGKGENDDKEDVMDENDFQVAVDTTKVALGVQLPFILRFLSLISKKYCCNVIYKMINSVQVIPIDLI